MTSNNLKAGDLVEIVGGFCCLKDPRKDLQRGEYHILSGRATKQMVQCDYCHRIYTFDSWWILGSVTNCPDMTWGRDASMLRKVPPLTEQEKRENHELFKEPSHA